MKIERFANKDKDEEKKKPTNSKIKELRGIIILTVVGLVVGAIIILFIYVLINWDKKPIKMKGKNQQIKK